MYEKILTKTEKRLVDIAIVRNNYKTFDRSIFINACQTFMPKKRCEQLLVDNQLAYIDYVKDLYRSIKKR
jgi:hypothetical protein